MARAVSPRRAAEVFGPIDGFFNTGNTAIAILGGRAEAGANGILSDDNTATASDAGSLASAGSDGINLDGFQATASGGQTDVTP